MKCKIKHYLSTFSIVSSCFAYRSELSLENFTGSLPFQFIGTGNTRRLTTIYRITETSHATVDQFISNWQVKKINGFNGDGLWKHVSGNNYLYLISGNTIRE